MLCYVMVILMNKTQCLPSRSSEPSWEKEESGGPVKRREPPGGPSVRCTTLCTGHEEEEKLTFIDHRLQI